MKRTQAGVLSLILAAALLLSLTACGSPKPTAQPAVPTADTQSQTPRRS